MGLSEAGKEQPESPAASLQARVKFVGAEKYSTTSKGGG
jgi:hypothetical protein